MDNWPMVEAELNRRLPQLLTSYEPIREALAQEDVLAPLLYPRKVVCTGANYREHMGEVGFSATFDKSRTRPSFFLKPPSTSIVGSGRSVRYPAQTRQFDWEIEMAVVMAKEARHVTAEAALDYVAGYTIGLDLSARDYLLHSGNLTGFDSFGGKAFNHSCPLGPHIVPARFIEGSSESRAKAECQWRGQAALQHLEYGLDNRRTDRRDICHSHP